MSGCAGTQIGRFIGKGAKSQERTGVLGCWELQEANTEKLGERGSSIRAAGSKGGDYRTVGSHGENRLGKRCQHKVRQLGQ